MYYPVNQSAIREVIIRQYQIIKEQTETISKLVDSKLDNHDVSECVNIALATAISAAELLAKLADILGMDAATKAHVMNQSIILENFKARFNAKVLG